MDSDLNEKELETIIVSLIHEVLHQNSQLQNIKAVLVEAVTQELSASDRTRLKELLTVRQDDAPLQWLSKAASNIREKIENARRDSGSEK
jgi:hypothetical protein